MTLPAEPHRPLRSGALAAVLGAIPSGHFLILGYEPFSLEFLGATLALAALGLGLGWVFARRWIYSLLLTLACYWFADVYFYNEQIWLTVILVLGALAILFWLPRLERGLLPMLIAFGLAWTGFSLFDEAKEILTPPLRPLPQAAASAQELPPVLHLVLDEQMSPTALPETIPAGHPAHAILQDYLDRGFDVFQNAGTGTHNTHKSISSLMSLAADPNNWRENGKLSDFSYDMIENREIKALESAGYQVRVIQSNYLKLCSEGVKASCHTYTRADNQGSFRRFSLSLRDRVTVALVAVHQNYIKAGPRRVRLYYWLHKRLFGAGHASLRNFGFFSRPVAMLDIADQLEAEIGSLRPGQAYIVHLIAPHFPFVLTTGCELKPMREWNYPVRHAARGTLPEVYRSYWDQSYCVHGRVMAIVDKILAHRNAIVFVHGDHGSRITSGTDQESPADLLQTFLAVRSATSAGALDAQPRELQPLFADLFKRLFAFHVSAAQPAQ